MANNSLKGCLVAFGRRIYKGHVLPCRIDKFIAAKP
jgi:hypothetical protein